MIVNSIHHLIADRPLIAVAPEASVREACALLDAHGIGALAVVARDRLLGILSERDVIRRCICADRAPADTPVSDVMTREPVTVAPGVSLSEAQRLMAEGGFRHLPVIDAAGRPVGMVSMRDIPTEYRLLSERAGRPRAAS